MKYVLYAFIALFGIFILPFWKGISMASIFALAIYPCLPKKEKRNISAKLIVVTTTLVTLLVISPFIFGIYAFSANVVNYSKQENNQQIFNADNLKSNISKRIDNTIKSLNLPVETKTRDMVEKLGNSVAETTLSFSMNIIKAIPELIIELLIFSLSLYFLLHYGYEMKQKIISLKLLTKKDIDELTMVLQKGSFECVVTLLLVGGIQAGTVLIGSAIAGFDQLMVIFLATFFLSFIPVIGAAPVAFFLAAVKLFENEPEMAILMSVTAIIAGTVDNVVKPLLIKRGIKIDGALALVIIIGSIVVMGLPGLLVGPVVGTTVAHYYDKYA